MRCAGMRRDSLNLSTMRSGLSEPRNQLSGVFENSAHTLASVIRLKRTILLTSLTDLAESHGVSLNIVMVAQDIQPRIQAMLNGLGIGPTYADSVEPELESGRLRMLPVEGFPVRIERVILSPKSEMPMATYQSIREVTISLAPR